MDITAERYFNLLQRLAADDKFREELSRRPVTTLRRHGIHIEASDLPESIELPPKSAIKRRLPRLRRLLERDPVHILMNLGFFE